MERDAPPRAERLGTGLDRLERALDRAKRPATLAPHAPPAPPAGPRRIGGAIGLVLGAGLVGVSLVTGIGWLVAPALLAGLAGGALLASRPRPPEGAGPHIGMGATVADDAVLAENVVVEMGATVGRGAVLRAGAVVGMGAEVKAGGVVEENAAVGWGATVAKGAVIGAGARVGPGATVKAGAHLPAGMVLRSGSTFGGRAGAAGASAAAPLPERGAEKDEDLERIDAVCDRIEAEIGGVSDAARAMVGMSGETARRIRATCHDLLRRERALRDECGPAALGRLEKERGALQDRMRAATDDAVRRSLAGALAALDDQKIQLDGLRTSADRLEAERARLVWTLEALGTHLVRLRAAGGEVAAGDGGALDDTLAALRGEIEAVAEALESVVADDRARQAKTP